jgi:hydrogenase maturation protein HypF
MQRRAIEVSGIVQGVGFRPFVYSLAVQLGLCGFVQNRSGTVLIEVEGSEPVLDTFLRRLQSQAPPLARIDNLTWQGRPEKGEQQFRIIASSSESSSQVFISPDVATCEDCRRELFDPSDRRYRYPFLNCTNCGPRLTIIRRAPYDRANTTMAPFTMCDRCRAEYENPGDRRFHAQPIACPDCGPRLQLLDEDGRPAGGDEPLRDFAESILSGKIGAMKGLGGYHLVCLAQDDAAIHRLRARKHREEKPLAVMVRDAAAAEKWCHVDRLERELLRSPRRPIVLLRKRRVVEQLGDAVAPENPFLGVMLPYTPLHELLLAAVGDRPLVMTSGNRSDEPIAHRDDDAVGRLRGIADRFLIHDRPIRVRCDDSVTRVIGGKESPVRRSRGDAPRPIALPIDCPVPMLAVGGQLKNVFALGTHRHAFLSHHIGDLDHLQAFEAFRRDIGLYEQMFDAEPQWIVHDLHPDYASTKYAVERAKRASLRLVGVQHHHAHLASCMAEHGLDGEVIGAIFDGTGLGTDGMIWGGEFLVGGYHSFRRAAHLRPVRLPGGDKAAKEPWRMALCHLDDAACSADDLLPDATPEQIRVIRQMIARGFHSPWTTSMGRLFDAVASLAGLRQRVSFEAQAAMQLEAFAMEVAHDESYPLELTRADEPDSVLQIDTRSLIGAVVDDRRSGADPCWIARGFHNTVAAMVVETCLRLRSRFGIDRVVCSGGVFMNALLSAQAEERLRESGFTVFQHHLVPPNDGGLSLGQLAIAASFS